MNHRPPAPANLPDPTVNMQDGWHALHLYYTIDQRPLKDLTPEQRRQGKEEIARILGNDRPDAPARLQGSVVSGHKADLGIIAFDTNPLVLDRIKHDIRNSTLGVALKLVYSFVSITEVSEYVPTLEQYGERLKLEGTDPASPAFAAKLKAYEDREVMMRKQRLFPDFPAWPILCFYPMNKIRDPQANWYLQPYSKRMELMSEHGRSGMMFAGKVSQVITASTGYDDYEWGVTLWGRAPEFIKDIVYTMRFDEASARYAEFGPFYISYLMPPQALIEQLQL